VTLIGALLIAVGPPRTVYACVGGARPLFRDDGCLGQIDGNPYFAGFAAAQLVCGPFSDGLGRRQMIGKHPGIPY